MAITNSSIKIFVNDSTGLAVSGANITITMAGLMISLVTDSGGYAAVGVSITNITTARVDVQADNLQSQTIDTLLGITENNIYITLFVGPNNLIKRVYICDTNGNPINEATVTIQGIISGSSGVDGYCYVRAIAGPLSLKIDASGYSSQVVIGTFSNSNFPAKFVMQTLVYASQPVYIQTIPGGIVALDDGVNYYNCIADVDGLAVVPGLLAPGPYHFSVQYNGYQSVDTTLLVVSGILYYSTGIFELEVDNGN